MLFSSSLPISAPRGSRVFSFVRSRPLISFRTILAPKFQLGQLRALTDRPQACVDRHDSHRIHTRAASRLDEHSCPSQSQEALLLSDLDLISPNALITSFLVYKLEPGSDAALITRALRRGLEFAAAHIPTMGARIHFDNNKPLKRLSPGSIRLRVRHFQHWEHKSHEELAAHSFQPRDFEQGRLVPVDAYDNVDERPVLIAQLSFIPGGVILALGFNHIAADGVSRDLALTTICEATRAYMSGTAPASPAPHLTFRRSSLAAPKEALNKPKEQLISRITDYRVVDAAAMAAAAKAAAHAKAGNPADCQNKTVIYTIQGSAVERLKKSCKPMGGADYLSTYDCVAAVLWRGLMRVRAQMKPDLRKGTSRMLHAVDLRRNSNTGLSSRYFGNAVKVVGAGPLPLPELLGVDGLSQAASSLRMSILRTSIADVADAVALGGMTGPGESLVFLPENGLADGDFMLSGWYFMNTAAYDFGVGPPEAVRPPDAGIPGFAFLFPDCDRVSGGRTYEIYLTLPTEEQDMLSQDPEFCLWFHGR